jgi:uncharacterized membrane protein YfcA
VAAHETGMLILVALGSGVGLVLALTGAGGSIIAVPILMFGMGWSVAQAGPVALLAVASSAAVGALIGLKMHQVRYRAAGLIALCGIPVTAVGMRVAHRVPETVLTALFACLLLFIALRTLRQETRSSTGEEPSAPSTDDSRPCLLDPNTGRLCWTPRCGRILAASGVGAGFLSGLFGVGGGFFIVPALRRVTDLSMNAIVATSMLVIALISTGAAISAAMAGHLSLAIGLPFALGAVGGMAVGRLIAPRMGNAGLSIAFAIACAVMSLLLLGRLGYAAIV